MSGIVPPLGEILMRCLVLGETHGRQFQRLLYLAHFRQLLRSGDHAGKATAGQCEHQEHQCGAEPYLHCCPPLPASLAESVLSGPAEATDACGLRYSANTGGWRCTPAKGSHQFQSPSRRMVAGTSSPRTSVASMITASAIPKPSATDCVLSPVCQNASCTRESRKTS